MFFFSFTLSMVLTQHAAIEITVRFACIMSWALFDQQTVSIHFCACRFLLLLRTISVPNTSSDQVFLFSEWVDILRWRQNENICHCVFSFGHSPPTWSWNVKDALTEKTSSTFSVSRSVGKWAGWRHPPSASWTMSWGQHAACCVAKWLLENKLKLMQPALLGSSLQEGNNILLEFS